MAESSAGSGGEDNGGNWWSSWVQAAKEKSAQTYECIKKDLSEFRNVCSNETSNMVARSSQALQETLQADHSQSTDLVKKGISSVLGSITNALTIPPDDDEDDAVLRVGSTGNLEMFDKAKVRLYEIQTSVTTYCTEPDGPVALFDTWRDDFDLESKKPEISELLVSVTEVRSIYTKLVPSAVSHADFWERYYYKVHQLNLDEQRKAELKTRADQLEIEEQDWGDDWGEDQGPSSSQPEVPTEPAATSKQIEPVSQPPDEAVSQPDEATVSSSAIESPDVSIQASTVALQHEDSTPSSPPAVDNVIQDTQAGIPETTDSNLEAASIAIETEKTIDTTQTKEPEEEAPVENIVPVETKAEGSIASEVKEVKLKEKGDYMIVGSDSNTPASSVCSTGKVSEDNTLDEEWEKELFGDDLKAVQELAEQIDINPDDVVADGWEDWE